MKIRMPEEHGAWGILLVPLVSSALVAGAGFAPFLLVATCALGGFILRGSWERMPLAERSLRGMLSFDHIVLASHTLGAAALLIFRYERTQLYALGALAAGLFLIHRALLQRHEENGTEKRSLAAELVGVGLLTLTAPAMWIAARGALDAEGTRVWLLNLLFFLGGVLYVKYRVRGLLAHRTFRGIGERARFAWPVFAYHLLLGIFLAAWILLANLSALVLVAFLPAILRATNLARHLGTKFPIKQLGWSEVGQAVLFAALLTLAFA